MAINKLLHINTITSPPYHQQSNGKPERMHSYQKTRIRLLGWTFDDLSLGKHNWEVLFNWINKVWNSTKRKNETVSPFQIMFGRRIKDQLYGAWDEIIEPELKEDYEDYVDQLILLRDITRLKVIETREIYWKKLQKQYNNKHKDIKYNIGDLVLLYIGDRSVGNRRKFNRQWIGPFLVHEVKSVRTLIISDLEGDKLRKVNGKQIMKFVEQLDWIKIIEETNQYINEQFEQSQ